MIRVSEIVNMFWPFPKHMIDPIVLEEAILRGNKTHLTIEEYIKTDIVSDKETIDFYKKFIEDYGLVNELSETRYNYKDIYTGQIDLVMKDKDGNLVISDIKTSSVINKPSYKMQMAFYWLLLMENLENDILPKAYILHMNHKKTWKVVEWDLKPYIKEAMDFIKHIERIRTIK